MLMDPDVKVLDRAAARELVTDPLTKPRRPWLKRIFRGDVTMIDDTASAIKRTADIAENAPRLKQRNEAVRRLRNFLANAEQIPAAGTSNDLVIRRARRTAAGIEELGKGTGLTKTRAIARGLAPLLLTQVTPWALEEFWPDRFLPEWAKEKVVPPGEQAPE
jgi:hypothetical protein